VYDNGTRYACPLFAAFKLRHTALGHTGLGQTGLGQTGLGQTGEGPRIGFTTPKGLGKAVVRNRIRRRVREAVRLELSSLSPEWAIVFNPRRKALDCLFGELQNEIKRFFNRCNESPPASLSSPSAGTNS
jgi:ribonuclease P protein component